VISLAAGLIIRRRVTQQLPQRPERETVSAL